MKASEGASDRAVIQFEDKIVQINSTKLIVWIFLQLFFHLKLVDLSYALVNKSVCNNYSLSLFFSALTKKYSSRLFSPHNFLKKKNYLWNATFQNIHRLYSIILLRETGWDTHKVLIGLEESHDVPSNHQTIALLHPFRNNTHTLEWNIYYYL